MLYERLRWNHSVLRVMSRVQLEWQHVQKE
jgi:hypothetical protein